MSPLRPQTITDLEDYIKALHTEQARLETRIARIREYRTAAELTVFGLQQYRPRVETPQAPAAPPASQEAAGTVAAVPTPEEPPEPPPAPEPPAQPRPERYKPHLSTERRQNGRPRVLTEEQVAQAAARRAGGETVGAIAATEGVSRNTLSSALNARPGTARAYCPQCGRKLDQGRCPGDVCGWIDPALVTADSPKA